jgi:hypothetical protein
MGWTGRQGLGENDRCSLKLSRRFSDVYFHSTKKSAKIYTDIGTASRPLLIFRASCENRGNF